MKTTSLILLLCLLFAFTTNPLLTAAQNTFNPVFDSVGERVQTGANYYALPAQSGNGGGLILASGRNATCPLRIVQDLNENTTGLPISFSPFNGDRVVRVATDLNIKFSVGRVCNQSTVWRLDANSQAPGPIFVTLGGVEGNPGRETLDNWFTIERFEDAYNFRYCPNVCRTCGSILCQPIGIVLDGGRRRLALSDQPFKVYFKKA